MKPERKAAAIMTAVGVSELWAIWAAVGSMRSVEVAALFVGPAPLLGWIAAAIVALIFVVATRSRFPLIGDRFLEMSSIKLSGVLFGALAGVAEEVWFRKILMDAAARHGFEPLTQIALSGLLFGAAHGVWGIFGGRWRAAAGAMSATFALGAALGVVYIFADRQIAPCIWAHVALNVLLEPWLLLAVITSGRRAGECKVTLSPT